jgi:hypothetical protein
MSVESIANAVPTPKRYRNPLVSNVLHDSLRNRERLFGLQELRAFANAAGSHILTRVGKMRLIRAQPGKPVSPFGHGLNAQYRLLCVPEWDGTRGRKEPQLSQATGNETSITIP